MLTYHSHNISGTAYAQNDHVALATDVEALHAAGARIVPLDEIADGVARGSIDGSGELIVGLSFDDGPVFDYYDFEHRRFGPQRSFRNILDDFGARHGMAPPHATSFVIASPEARAAMERAEDCGYPDIDAWLRDGWWIEAAKSGRHAIGNHSWDHVHHAVATVALSSETRDDFSRVDTYADADAQVRHAGEFINAKVGQRCSLFAYPFGHVNRYLVEEYFPGRHSEHRMRAAFSVARGLVPPGCPVWNIPRMVCGEHWRDVRGLLDLLHVA